MQNTLSIDTLQKFIKLQNTKNQFPKATQNIFSIVEVLENKNSI